MPATNFETAGRQVLGFLRRRIGFDLWMITRARGDDWIVLQSEDHGYNVQPGAVFRWADSFCSQMVQGNGPHIAPRSALVPAYADAPIGRQVPIEAYVGVPLELADHSLFGTLCAIAPTPQPEAIVQEQELVELLGGLLSSILQQELFAADEARRGERHLADALGDALTGLHNRRGWDRLLAAEEERCRRYGHAATVLVVDLDDMKRINDTEGHAAGDEYLRRTGAALRQAVRTNDVVARLGGDEFGVIAVECDRQGAPARTAGLRAALAAAAVRASVGCAARVPADGLFAAWQAADRAMYEDKRYKWRQLEDAPSASGHLLPEIDARTPSDRENAPNNQIKTGEPPA